MAQVVTMVVRVYWESANDPSDVYYIEAGSGVSDLNAWMQATMREISARRDTGKSWAVFELSGFPA